jgi:hypothetical protein
MAYRNDLDALLARKTALEDEVRDRTQELDSTRRLVDQPAPPGGAAAARGQAPVVDELEARKRLPVLDNIRVAAPCSASWDKMIGDARVRACADCNKSVYNLSDMTRDQAEAVILEHEGRLCVRYFERADGTILLKDCEVGVKRRRRRRVVAVSAAAGIAASLFGYSHSQRAKCSLGEMRLDNSVDVELLPASPAPKDEPPRATLSKRMPGSRTQVPPRAVMGIPPAPSVRVEPVLKMKQGQMRANPVDDQPASPFGGAAARGQAPAVDDQPASPFGGAAARGQAPAVDQASAKGNQNR